MRAAPSAKEWINHSSAYYIAISQVGALIRTAVVHVRVQVQTVHTALKTEY